MVDDVQLNPAVVALCRHEDGRRDCERIRDEVVDDLAEALRRAPHAQAALAAAGHVRARARAGRPAPRRRRPARSPPPRRRGRARAAPRRAGRGGRPRRAPAPAGSPRFSSRRRKRGQRRPQLVGGVRDEGLLRLEQRLELRRRLVQLPREPPHLRRAFLRRPCLEVPGADLRRRLLDPAKRPRHAAREPQADERHACEDGRRDRRAASASTGARAGRPRRSDT